VKGALYRWRVRLSWEMQEGGHLMHPEVKLGASGWRPHAFTVLNDV